MSLLNQQTGLKKRIKQVRFLKKEQHFHQGFKKLLILSFVLTLIFAPRLLKAETTEAEKLMQVANEQYNEARYDSALTIYNEIIESGKTSPELLYNTANAYYKLRDIPSAILYYEKALKIAPNDEDIIHNLEVANGQIIDRIEPVPQLFLKNWWHTFYTMFPADLWAVISLISFAVLLIFALIFLLSHNKIWRKIGFFTGLFLLLITLGTFGMASQKYYYTKQTNEAIIFTPTITVKSSPSASSVDLFVLHEGTKVSLLDEVDNWQKIRIANGSVGWLPAEASKGI